MSDKDYARQVARMKPEEQAAQRERANQMKAWRTSVSMGPFKKLRANLDDFVRAINRAEPGLIRVDADETTYSLHIILRFELEQELIDGTVALEDLPEVWNARMQEFLGVDVPAGRTRLKLLEFFAAGLPVVCTTKAAEGLDDVGGTGGVRRRRWTA